MVSASEARKLALSMPESDEHPHFERAAFRVKKKIFMTLHEKKKQAVVKLSVVDQSVFVKAPNNAIMLVPNKSAAQGWTLIDLTKVQKTIFRDAVQSAWFTVAPTQMVQQYFPDRNA